MQLRISTLVTHLNLSTYRRKESGTMFFRYDRIDMLKNVLGGNDNKLNSKYKVFNTLLPFTIKQ